jgi:hypothetical protein
MLGVTFGLQPRLSRLPAPLNKNLLSFVGYGKVDKQFRRADTRCVINDANYVSRHYAPGDEQIVYDVAD